MLKYSKCNVRRTKKTKSIEKHKMDKRRNIMSIHSLDEKDLRYNFHLFNKIIFNGIYIKVYDFFWMKQKKKARNTKRTLLYARKK